MSFVRIALLLPDAIHPPYGEDYLRPPVRFSCIVKGSWPDQWPGETKLWTEWLGDLRRWGERAAVTDAGWVNNIERRASLCKVQGRNDHEKLWLWRCNEELRDLCVPRGILSDYTPPDRPRLDREIREKYTVTYYDQI